jgi:hypothetical protein
MGNSRDRRMPPAGGPLQIRRVGHDA